MSNTEMSGRDALMIAGLTLLSIIGVVSGGKLYFEEAPIQQRTVFAKADISREAELEIESLQSQAKSDKSTNPNTIARAINQQKGIIDKSKADQKTANDLLVLYRFFGTILGLSPLIALIFLCNISRKYSD
jgi:hypothetical protein